MVRAANTGVSAIIDQNGHISSMTGIFTESFRTGEVRPGSGDSIYLMIGDTAAWLCVLLTAGVAAMAWFKRRSDA
jgi:apolipoprotein N-acyltransferase